MTSVCDKQQILITYLEKYEKESKNCDNFVMENPGMIVKFMLPVLLQAQIQKFLTNNLGPSGRGFTTLEIKKAINTSFTTRQLSVILKSLVNLKILYFTGYTKGKRFVLGEYSKIALGNFEIDCKISVLQNSHNSWRRWNDAWYKNDEILFGKLKEKRMSVKKYCQSLPEFQKLTIE